MLVCNTGMDSAAATAELAFALILACARAVPRADAVMRGGGWHAGRAARHVLAGKRLGIVGLGKLGSRVAGYGRAFGMEVVAWSQNLTEAAAVAGGARLVSKAELFASSDVVSIHSSVGAHARPRRRARARRHARRRHPGQHRARPHRGRGGLLAELARGRLTAVSTCSTASRSRRPPPARAPQRGPDPAPGYAAAPVFAQVYRESVENIVAFLSGAPSAS
jgi:hypothetical protein